MFAFNRSRTHSFPRFDYISIIPSVRYKTCHFFRVLFHISLCILSVIYPCDSEETTLLRFSQCCIMMIVNILINEGNIIMIVTSFPSSLLNLHLTMCMNCTFDNRWECGVFSNWVFSRHLLNFSRLLTITTAQVELFQLNNVFLTLT